MKRKPFKIRLGLALAIAVAALALASSAQAMPVIDAGSGSSAQTRVVAGTSSVFNWGDAGIGAGVALGAALAGIGAVRFTRSRGRLAGQH